MKKRSSHSEKAALLQGTLDMLIMQALQWGPEHGHGIGQLIRARSLDLLSIEAGSLYPALHRLERQGMVAWEWKLSDNKQRAKYYRMTAAGRKHLVAEESRWNLLVKAITRVRRPA